MVRDVDCTQRAGGLLEKTLRSRLQSSQAHRWHKMKFIIEKKDLTRLLRVLSSDPTKKAHDPVLRLAAQDGQPGTDGWPAVRYASDKADSAQVGLQSASAALWMTSRQPAAGRCAAPSVCTVSYGTVHQGCMPWFIDSLLALTVP